MIRSEMYIFLVMNIFTLADNRTDTCNSDLLAVVKKGDNHKVLCGCLFLYKTGVAIGIDACKVAVDGQFEPVSSLSLSLSLSFSLFVCVSLSQSVCLSVSLTLSLFLSLCVCVCVCVSLSLSTYFYQ